MLLAEFPRIAQDPAIMTGKPCIAHTRNLLLRKLAAGETRAQLRDDYPGLVEADLDAALAYAAALAPRAR